MSRAPHTGSPTERLLPTVWSQQEPFVVGLVRVVVAAVVVRVVGVVVVFVNDVAIQV